MTKIRVLVVGAHGLYQEALVETLSTDDIVVAGQASHGVDALEAARRIVFDVVIFDASSRNETDFANLRGLVAVHPSIPVVTLASSSSTDDVLETLDAGSVGYLLKSASAEEIRQGVRSARAGQSPLSPEVTGGVVRALRQRRPSVTLTTRESDVLRLVTAGMGNKAIAQELAISEKTVKCHLSRMFQRLGVADRTQAAVWAERNGLYR